MRRAFIPLLLIALASQASAQDGCDFVESGGTGNANLYGGTSSNEGIDRLDPKFRDALSAMMADAAAELGGTMQIYSGYRSIERQRELWEAALAKYGDPEIADNWVAPPGNSMHNFGMAVDMSWNGQTIQYGSPISDWLSANMGKYGLTRPLSNEGWHIEPIGGRSGATGDMTGAAGAGGEECKIVDMINLPVIFLMPWETKIPFRAALPGSYTSNAQ